ncbi:MULTISPECIES: S24 family peptidase [unclassified Carboxylicivirga]|uniref:S24 family peptidase n=1 Tax=Carboxylicivirga TaxID=1628153 RepID=UPI003D3375DC
MDNNYTTIKERVLYFAKNQNIGIEFLLKKIGMTYGSFKGKAKKGTLNSDAIDNLLTIYPNINPRWLISGQGEMLLKSNEEAQELLEESKNRFDIDIFLERQGLTYEILSEKSMGNYSAEGIRQMRKITNKIPSQFIEMLKTNFGSQAVDECFRPISTIEEEYLLKQTRKDYLHTGPTGNTYKDLNNGKYKVSVPLVPAYAYAQYLTDYQADELKERFEYVDFVVDFIGKGKYYAFEIKGDSMDDDSKRSIPDGSTVLARDVKQEYWKDKLHFNKFPYWIIVHQNSIMCKQIVEHDVERGVIKCHSLNDSPEYSDFEVDLREVRQLLNIVKVQTEVKFL